MRHRNVNKNRAHHENELTNIGPSQEEISKHAFDIYLANGQVNGRATEDWQQAETELNAAQSNSLLERVDPKGEFVADVKTGDSEEEFNPHKIDSGR